MPSILSSSCGQPKRSVVETEELGKGITPRDQNLGSQNPNSLTNSKKTGKRTLSTRQSEDVGSQPSRKKQDLPADRTASALLHNDKDIVHVQPMQAQAPRVEDGVFKWFQSEFNRLTSEKNVLAAKFKTLEEEKNEATLDRDNVKELNKILLKEIKEIKAERKKGQETMKARIQELETELAAVNGQQQQLSTATPEHVQMPESTSPADELLPATSSPSTKSTTLTPTSSAPAPQDVPVTKKSPLLELLTAPSQNPVRRSPAPSSSQNMPLNQFPLPMHQNQLPGNMHYGNFHHNMAPGHFHPNMLFMPSPFAPPPPFNHQFYLNFINGNHGNGNQFGNPATNQFPPHF